MTDIKDKTKDDIEVWQAWTDVSEKLPATVEDAGPQTPIRVSPSWVAKTVPPKKNKPHTVNQLLDEAATFFENGGKWVQKAIGGNKGEVCAVGALLASESGDRDNVYIETQPYRHPLTSAAVEKLAKHLTGGEKLIKTDPWEDPNFTVVSEWNDAEGRTQSDVVKLLRKAARE